METESGGEMKTPDLPHAAATTAVERWLARRDQDAAALLVREHRPQVLRTARAWGAPEWMVEDVVQEVFLRVFRALPMFEPRRPLGHWVARIARNTCARLRRHWCRRHRLGAGFANGAGELAEDHLAAENPPDSLAMQREFITRLQQALQSLPERERACLEARLTEDGPPSSPADRVLLHRARKRLRQRLHGRPEDWNFHP